MLKILHRFIDEGVILLVPLGMLGADFLHDRIQLEHVMHMIV